MNTTIVNVRHDDCDVYIGRATPRAGNPRYRRASMFANPFRVGHDAPSSEEVLELYERWMRNTIALQPELRNDLLSLEGKRLGCWCAPKPCHGHVLLKLIDEAKGGGL